MYRYRSKAVYEGEWRHNLKDGRGVYYFARGGVYEGEWRGGEREGVGVQTYASGQVKVRWLWIVWAVCNHLNLWLGVGCVCKLWCTRRVLCATSVEQDHTFAGPHLCGSTGWSVVGWAAGGGPSPVAVLGGCGRGHRGSCCSPQRAGGRWRLGSRAAAAADEPSVAGSGGCGRHELCRHGVADHGAVVDVGITDRGVCHQWGGVLITAQQTMCGGCRLQWLPCATSCIDLTPQHNTLLAFCSPRLQMWPCS